LTHELVQVAFQLTEMNVTVFTTVTMSGGEPALSDASVTLALLGLSANPSLTIVSTANLGKPAVCGDGACALSEVAVQQEAASVDTCPGDCPFTIGICPTPGSLDVGDASKVAPNYLLA
jgi:hypothetical protein